MKYGPTKYISIRRPRTPKPGWIFHAARQTPKNAKAGSRFARTAERRITAILIALSDGTRADEDDDCAADFRPGIYPARLTPPRHSACAGRFSNASTLCLSRS